MRIFLIGAGILAGALYLWNASWLAQPAVPPRLDVLAHRGVHQTFSLQRVTRQSCTAKVIDPPRHGFIENTIPAMRAAFDAGADVVELDIQTSKDGQLVVFHDATLDCRTEASGAIANYTAQELQRLDVGFGYTADDGKTYPFRGQGIGLLPTLAQVFSAFPGKRFLVNFKSNNAEEGHQLVRFLTTNPQWRANVWSVYGGDNPTRATNTAIPDLKGFGTRQMKTCLMRYVGLGWSGYVPQTCRNTHVMVPINFAWAMWGWPNRFVERMQKAGSDIILIGPYSAGDAGSSGIDRPDVLEQVPDQFSGWIWTNKVQEIGPAIQTARGTKTRP